jgi:hypothetical protein
VCWLHPVSVVAGACASLRAAFLLSRSFAFHCFPFVTDGPWLTRGYPAPPPSSPPPPPAPSSRHPDARVQSAGLYWLPNIYSGTPGHAVFSDTPLPIAVMADCGVSTTAVGDVNGDGYLDVCGAFFSSDVHVWALNQGPSAALDNAAVFSGEFYTFELPEDVVCEGAQSVTFGDVDNDGDVDAVGACGCVLAAAAGCRKDCCVVPQAHCLPWTCGVVQ